MSAEVTGSTELSWIRGCGTVELTDALAGAGLPAQAVIRISLSGALAPGDLILRIRAAVRSAMPDPVLWPDVADPRGGLADVLANRRSVTVLLLTDADQLDGNPTFAADLADIDALVAAAPRLHAFAVTGPVELPARPVDAHPDRRTGAEVNDDWSAVGDAVAAWSDDRRALDQFLARRPADDPFAVLLSVSPRLDGAPTGTGRYWPGGAHAADAPAAIAVCCLDALHAFWDGHLAQSYRALEVLRPVLESTSGAGLDAIRALGWLVSGFVLHPQRTPWIAIADFERAADAARTAGVENLARLAEWNRAAALGVSGNTVEAADALGRLREPETWSPVLPAARVAGGLTRGYVALDRLDLAAAAAAAESMVRLAPRGFPGLYLDHLLASIDFYHGSTPAAFGRLQRELNVHSQLLTELSLPRWLFQRSAAEMLMALGEPTEALEMLDRGDGELSDHPFLETARATALFQLGRVQDASGIVRSHLWKRRTSARNRMALLLISAQIQLFHKRRRAAADDFAAALDLVRLTASYRPFALLPEQTLETMISLVPAAAEELEPVIAWALPPDLGSGAVLVSRRERIVLDAVSLGRTNREIAELLQVSQNTVKSQLRSVFRKLGVSDRSEAVARAVSLGLLDRQRNVRTTT